MSATQAQPAETATRPDPRLGGGLERWGRGFGYLMQGWAFVGKHPSLIKFCLLPMLLTILVFIGTFWGFWHYYADIVAFFWKKPDGWTAIFWWVFYVLFFFAAIMLGYVLFFVVQSLLTAPFNDLLSERVEEVAYGNAPKPFSLSFMMKNLGRTLVHELARLGIYLAWMVPLLLLNFVPVIGTIAFSVGGFILTARFLAYNNLEYCMARREWRFARKRQLLRDHRSLTNGLGMGVALVLLVPVVGLLSVPMAAVGGTLLFCDLDKAGAFEATPAADAGSEPA